MQENLPAWRERLDDLLSRHAHLPFSRFVQAATVRPDGLPANRTLTFRFLEADKLLFTADSRTEKMEQINRTPWAELCWYFTESRVQMRLLGTFERKTRDECEALRLARLRTWKERTDEARQSFTWPPAGLPLSSPAAFSLPAPEEPPSTFTLLLFTPQQVETLDLSCHPFARERHALESGEWRSVMINP